MEHNYEIRHWIDPKKEHRYSIVDGTKEITIADLMFPGKGKEIGGGAIPQYRCRHLRHYFCRNVVVGVTDSSCEGRPWLLYSHG
jgi:hypothetical protein